jgi:hypothetical protein
VKGTIVSSRQEYLRVRWDESGLTQTMHPTWMLVYLPPTTSNPPAVTAKESS